VQLEKRLVQPAFLGSKPKVEAEGQARAEPRRVKELGKRLL
jgi:hypothetical protein